MTAPNITQDKETGIGKWSDADIKKLMRTGLMPNGVHVAMIMPTGFYHIMTERDLDAVVAYLRTIKPISNKVADPIYKMPQVEHVLPGGEKPFTEAMMTDKVKKGFYLASIAHCMECHTPMEKGARQWDTRLGAGGFEFPGPWGVSVSRNITSSKTKGIGSWTDAEIKRAITTGVVQGRQPPQAADGLPLLRHADAGRPRRRRRLSAHGAGQGVIGAFTVHRRRGIQ